MNSKDQKHIGPTLMSLSLPATSPLEHLDLENLQSLQDDALVSFRDIGRKIAVAVGTVQMRIKKSEKDRKQFEVLLLILDYSKRDFGLISLILL